MFLLCSIFLTIFGKLEEKIEASAICDSWNETIHTQIYIEVNWDLIWQILKIVQTLKLIFYELQKFHKPIRVTFRSKPKFFPTVIY